MYVRTGMLCKKKLAEGEGFEPPVTFNATAV